MFRRVFVLIVCAAVAGCAGRALPPAAGMQASSDSLRAVPAAPRAKTLFVSTDLRPTEVFALRATANGSVAPLRTIGNTTIPHYVQGQSIAYDPARNRIWVSSCIALGGLNSPIVAFDANANGPNVTPKATIYGPKTGLNNCVPGVALDAAGNVYTANFVTKTSPGGDIPIFSAAATGNVAPTRLIAGTKPNIRSPYGLAVNSKGQLYVTNTCFFFAHCPGTGITIYAKGAKGNIAPIASIPGGTKTKIDIPQGVAFDAAGNVYVTDQAGRIEVFAPNPNGNVAPIRVIKGSALCSPSGIAVDKAGYVYVGNLCDKEWPVLVYAPGAKGNATPVQSITIKATYNHKPSGIALAY